MKLVLTIGAIAVLAACSGRQSPTAIPASSLSQVRAHRATSGDLLYTLGTNGTVYVYTYPGGTPAGQLTEFDGNSGLCTDAAGDVFIPSITGPKTRSSTIYEYQHGGTTPIATLSDEGSAFGCAVDPKTGNLAVVNGFDEFNPYGKFSSVAVYAGAQGNATMYFNPSLGMWSDTYDNKGNLYVATTTTRRDHAGIAVLRPGGTTFDRIRFRTALYYNPSLFLPTVQWDGQYLAVTSNKRFTEPAMLYQLSITGRKASIVTSSTLEYKHHIGWSYIDGSTMIGVEQSGGWNVLSLWAYPQGGEPQSQILKVLKKSDGKLFGVVVSPGS